MALHSTFNPHEIDPWTLLGLSARNLCKRPKQIEKLRKIVSKNVAKKFSEKSQSKRPVTIVTSSSNHIVI